MTDSALNQFVTRGTAAARAAFTPTPPLSSSGYFWFETDTSDTYSWSGSAWVKVNTGAAPALRGALVTKLADQTGANYTSSPTYIAFDSESYDTDAIHDNVTNNSRLTVPSGVTKIRLKGQASLNNHTANKFTLLAIDKNGATTAYVGQAAITVFFDSAFPIVNASSPVITVTAGDYFQLRLLVETDTSVDVIKDQTWFAMEIVA